MFYLNMTNYTLKTAHPHCSLSVRGTHFKYNVKMCQMFEIISLMPLISQGFSAIEKEKKKKESEERTQLSNLSSE